MATRGHRVQEERSFPGRHRVSQHAGKLSTKKITATSYQGHEPNQTVSKIVSLTTQHHK